MGSLQRYDGVASSRCSQVSPARTGRNRSHPCSSASAGSQRRSPCLSFPRSRTAGDPLVVGLVDPAAPATGHRSSRSATTCSVSLNTASCVRRVKHFEDPSSCLRTKQVSSASSTPAGGGTRGPRGGNLRRRAESRSLARRVPTRSKGTGPKKAASTDSALKYIGTPRPGDGTSSGRRGRRAPGSSRPSGGRKAPSLRAP
mmetsp:Transcript_5588/g.19197  ORF Transcript_5588/g.19197 Transcript_5588/m.19197 type:complete len:200 (+) Transcript_5588:630-1229(+)